MAPGAPDAVKLLYVIEHWAVAEPDAGRKHLIERGFDVRVIEPWRGDALPDLTGDEAGVMIMGGPQMISEASRTNNKFLLEEIDFIEQVMAKNMPLVGVCLGSQMIAKAMGAGVGYREDRAMAMGYYPISVAPDGKALGLQNDMMVLNGNSQNWDLPEGATLLAEAADDTNPHPNQAFMVGNTLALQFHPEVTRAILNQWQTEFGSSIGKPGTQSKTQQDAGFEAYDAPLKQWYHSALDRWFGKADA